MGILAEVVKVAIFFFLLFTSYISFQNVITQLYEQLGQPNLGKLSIFTIYASFMIGGLVAPFVGKRINFKKLFVASAICYSLNLGSGIFLYYIGYGLVATVVVVVAAIIGGSSASLLWVAQAAYIHFLCEQNGLQHKKGYYFGIFYGIFSISNLSSALITTFMLGFFGIVLYFWILFGIGIFAVLFGLAIVTNVQKKYADRESKAQSVVIMEREAKNEIAPVKLIPAVIKVFKYYSKMKPLLSPIGLVGIAIAFYASSLHKILELALPADADKSYINLRTGFMFLALGVGEITGGYSSGGLSDKLSIQKVGSIALCSFYLAVILSQLAITFHQTVVPVMFAAFFWGFQEAYIQNWITVVCSRTHKGALEAFVINKQFHSLTICLYEIVLILLKPSLDIVMPTLLVLGLTCILSLPFIKEQPTTTKESLLFRQNIQSIDSEASAT